MNKMTIMLSKKSLIAILVIVSNATSFTTSFIASSKATKFAFQLHLSSSVENDKNPNNVSRVSVCLGELCKCQEQSSEYILKDLLSKKLPFDVEDAPCLGACGVGAMISIEYENGDYELVEGLEETYRAIGIVDTDINVPDTKQLTIKNDTIMEKYKELTPTPSADDNYASNSAKLSDQQQVMKKDTEVVNNVTPNNTIQNSPSIDEAHGAVQRMREEARKQQEERINPWVNMAMLLANKAKDSVLKK